MQAKLADLVLGGHGDVLKVVWLVLGLQKSLLHQQAGPDFERSVL